MRNGTTWRAAGLAAAALLAGCGDGAGGWGKDDAVALVQSAPVAPLRNGEGLYIGNTTSGLRLYLLILENGALWGWYGPGLSGGATSPGGIGGFTAQGLLQGTSTLSGASLAMADGRDFGASASVAPVTLSASLHDAVTLDGFVTPAAAGLGPAVGFSAGVPSSVVYRYTAAASPGAASGTWTSFNAQGAATTLSITGSGSIAGNVAGCLVSGTLTPRASGRNVFDASLTFGAAPCAQPGGSARGVAITLGSAGTAQQLLVGAVDANRASGIAWSFSR